MGPGAVRRHRAEDEERGSSTQCMGRGMLKLRTWNLELRTFAAALVVALAGLFPESFLLRVPRVLRGGELTARGESLAAFDGRCIPGGCVAPRSNTPGILGRRALPAGRLARLGATPDFHHGLLILMRALTLKAALLLISQRALQSSGQRFADCVVLVRGCSSSF